MNEFTGVTTIHPVGAGILGILGLAMLLAPRAYALLPTIVLVCFIPVSQRVVIAGADFHFLRIMTVFGWVRILSRNEAAGFRFKPIDLWQIAVVGIGTAIYLALRTETSALVYRLGYAFDAVGMYFMFRVLVRDGKDVDRVIRSFVILSIPVAGFFLIEYVTHRNMFSVFGGVSPITHVRDGRLRCQGAFAHAILAGVFWGTTLPLMVGRLALVPRERWLGVAGVLATLFIVFTTSSSTPVMSVLFTIFGCGMFVFRRRMRAIRWGSVVALIALHLVMKGPVWSLIARVNVISGSTGWHRYHLIDAAIKHFDDWWALGTLTTENWDAWGQLRDITNQYVFEGVNGGLWTLLAFVGLIAAAFAGVGRFVRARRGDLRAEWFGWCVGVTLFVHAMNFIALTYFAQMIMHWLLTLAIVGAIAPARRAVPAARPARASRPAGLERGRPRVPAAS